MYYTTSENLFKDVYINTLYDLPKDIHISYLCCDNVDFIDKNIVINSIGNHTKIGEIKEYIIDISSYKIDELYIKNYNNIIIKLPKTLKELTIDIENNYNNPIDKLILPILPNYLTDITIYAKSLLYFPNVNELPPELNTFTLINVYFYEEFIDKYINQIDYIYIDDGAMENENVLELYQDIFYEFNNLDNSKIYFKIEKIKNYILSGNIKPDNLLDKLSDIKISIPEIRCIVE